MAFERLKALDNYLQECKELPNFLDILEQQSVQLVKEIRELQKLELEAAAPLIALVQQNALWTPPLRETICQAIHEKVLKSMEGRTVKDRASLQNYMFVPQYLTQGDWDTLMSSSNIGLKSNTVMERCFRLGLRNPTEDTYATVTVLLLLRDQDRFMDPLQLRSSYLTTKQLCKDFLERKKKEPRRREKFISTCLHVQRLWNLLAGQWPLVKIDLLPSFLMVFPWNTFSH